MTSSVLTRSVFGTVNPSALPSTTDLAPHVTTEKPERLAAWSVHFTPN
jgi:hypothetical protein